MRLRLACAVLGLALLLTASASAAETFDARQPIGGPVLTADGVVWGAADGVGSHLLLHRGGRTSTLVSVKGSHYSDGFYTVGKRVYGVAAQGQQIAYGVSVYDSAASKYDGGDGLVQASLYETSPGTAPAEVSSCGYELGTPQLAFGDGFTIRSGCFKTLFSSDPADLPPVAIGTTLLGRGRSVQAAGAYAAWDDGTALQVYHPATAATVGTAPRGWGWALLSDGSVVLNKSTGLQVVAPGGATSDLATEPGGVFGLTSGATTLAYTTASGPGERTVVARRGAERIEVGRIWAVGAGSPDWVATDGTRVAFLSPACGGRADLTVTTIGEPLVDRRVAPCPVTIAPEGVRTKRRLMLALACDPDVPPVDTCAGTAVVRAKGKVIARGPVSVVQSTTRSLPLTTAGRRIVAKAGGHAVTARVVVTRDTGTTQPVSRARVRLR